MNSAPPADPPPQPTVTGTATESNADGSVSVTTLYSDGTRRVAQHAGASPTLAKSPLGATQLAPLLAAQESRAPAVVSFGQSPYATIR